MLLIKNRMSLRMQTIKHMEIYKILQKLTSLVTSLI